MSDKNEQADRGLRCASIGGDLARAAQSAGLRVIYTEDADGNIRVEGVTRVADGYDYLVATSIGEAQMNRVLHFLRTHRPAGAVLVGTDLPNDTRFEMATLGYEADDDAGVTMAWLTPAVPKVRAKLYGVHEALRTGAWQ